MNNTQPPNITRALVTGGVMAGVGVGGFLVLYLSLSGMEQLPRLLIALCVPPVILSFIIGGYILRRRA